MLALAMEPWSRYMGVLRLSAGQANPRKHALEFLYAHGANGHDLNSPRHFLTAEKFFFDLESPVEFQEDCSVLCRHWVHSSYFSPQKSIFIQAHQIRFNIRLTRPQNT